MCVDQKFFKNHPFLMQIPSCTSKIILFSLSTAVCLAIVKNFVNVFLPKDFTKVEMEAVFSICALCLQGNLTPVMAVLTIILILD